MQKSNNFLDKIFLLRSPHDFCRPCHRNLSESWEWLFDGGIVLNFFMFFSGSLTRQSLDGHLVNTHSSLSSPGTAVKGGSRWHRLQIWKGAVWNRYRLMAETSTTTAVFWRVVSAHRLCRLYVKAPYSFSTDECYGSTNFDCFVPGAKWYVCRFCMILLMKEFSHGSTVGAIYIYIYRFLFVFVYIYNYVQYIYIYYICIYKWYIWYMWCSNMGFYWWIFWGCKKSNFNLHPKGPLQVSFTLYKSSKCIRKYW